MYGPYSSSLADSRPFLDVESLLHNLAQDFVTAFNTGNYDQAAALFISDGAFMVPHQEPAYGPKAVERLLRQLGEGGYQDLRLETLRVESSGGDMAMEIGRFTVAIRQGDGTIIPDRGKYVKVWRRLGAWLIVADCWSSNLPAQR
ncbi:MAG: nuclear transport factor 2 family protein [Candidatus Sulfotelmatobacter sp.]